MLLIQVLNILIPFFYYPYLIEVYGLSSYGNFVQAQVIVSIFSIFIDFGINIGFVKLSQLNGRVDKRNLSKYIIISIIIKITTIIISVALILSLSSFFEYIKAIRELVFIILFYVIFDVFTPFWFYQVCEKLKSYTLLMFFNKISMLTFVLFFIDVNSSLSQLSILYSASYLPATLASLIYIVYFIKKNSPLHFGFSDIVSSLKFTFNFLLSNFSSTAVSKMSSILVGTSLGSASVAVFDFIEKILTLSLTPLYLLNQAVYPVVCKKMDARLVFNLIYFVFPSTLLYWIIMYFFGSDFFQLAFSSSSFEYPKEILILLAVVPVNSINYLLGTTYLVVFGYEKMFRKSVTFSFFFFCSILFFIKYLDLVSINNICISIFIYYITMVLLRVLFIIMEKIGYE